MPIGKDVRSIHMDLDNRMFTVNGKDVSSDHIKTVKVIIEGDDWEFSWTADGLNAKANMKRVAPIDTTKE